MRPSSFQWGKSLAGLLFCFHFFQPLILFPALWKVLFHQISLDVTRQPRKRLRIRASQSVISLTSSCHQDFGRAPVLGVWPNGGGMEKFHILIFSQAEIKPFCRRRTAVLIVLLGPRAPCVAEWRPAYLVCSPRLSSASFWIIRHRCRCFVCVCLWGGQWVVNLALSWARRTSLLEPYIKASQTVRGK